MNLTADDLNFICVCVCVCVYMYIKSFLHLFISLGRELSGLPSKHSAKGRDRSVYFIWQGRSASLNERGAAALLTVELDSNRGPQVNLLLQLSCLFEFNITQNVKKYI